MAKKLKPIHPGEQLREEFMVPLGLSSTHFIFRRPLKPPQFGN